MDETMAIYELDGVAPLCGPGVWVADSADVMGRVELGENASVWFGAVIRGDTAHIKIGKTPTCRMAVCCMPMRAYR